MKRFSKLQWFYLLIIIVALAGIILTGILPICQMKQPDVKPPSSSQSSVVTSDLLPPVDFEHLTSENPDTVAWLSVPDTDISTPVVQTDNNETYLYTDFYGNYSNYGCAFLDASYDTAHRPSPQNMVVYGHNHRTDHSLFGELEKYLDKQFYETHRFIRFDRPDNPGIFEVFAVLKISDDYDYRRPDFANKIDFLNYFTRIQSESLYANDSCVLLPDDEILTLSTCIFNESNADRLIVLCRKTA